MKTVSPLVTKLAGSMVAVLSCHDRLIFKGYLPFGGDEHLNAFLDRRLQIRRKDFLPEVQRMSQQMDVLRGQTPEMVCKETWACLLAYNQIRTVIAQVAAQHGTHPSKISPKRALRTVESFRPPLATARPQTLATIYEHLLQATASRQIGDRPGREEPQCVKRRPKPYPRLTQPRNEARTACREKG